MSVQTLHLAKNIIEAMALREDLNANDICCTLDEWCHVGFAGSLHRTGEVAVLVDSSELAAAESVLAAFEERYHSVPPSIVATTKNKTEAFFFVVLLVFILLEFMMHVDI